MSVDVRGMDRLMNGLREAERRQLAAGVVAMQQGAAHVLGLAQEFAPVDTGTLKGSAVIGDPIVSRDGASVELGFNTDYAAAVHERLDQRINLVANPLGQSKYLASPMASEADKVATFVSDAMAAAAKGGAT